MANRRRRFIADAAHELRTPIAALGVQAENLGRVGQSLDGRERLAVLRTGIQRVSHLLDQLLALARYEATEAVDRPVTAVADAAK